MQSFDVTRRVLPAQNFCNESNQPTSAWIQFGQDDYTATLITDDHSFNPDQQHTPSFVQGCTITEGSSVPVTGKPLLSSRGMQL